MTRQAIGLLIRRAIRICDRRLSCEALETARLCFNNWVSENYFLQPLQIELFRGSQKLRYHRV